MNTGSGIQFNTDGPVMSGTWFNPKTGHKFTVRDCFFQDGQFLVQTMEGQTLDYNTIQNYIQVTDQDGHSMEPDESLMVTKNERVRSELPAEVSSILDTDLGDDFSDMIDPDDQNMIKGLGNINESPRHIVPASEHQVPTVTSTPQPTNQAYNEDLAMVDRVLRRFPVPDFETELAWACPEKQIETLVDILGIDPMVIAEYYVNKLNKDQIFENIKKKLADYIDSQWGSGSAQATSQQTQQTQPAQESIPTPKTTKPKTTKKKK